MVLTYSHRISRVLCYSGILLSIKMVSLTGLLPYVVYLSRYLQLPFLSLCRRSKPQKNYFLWFGLLRFRSPLLTQSLIYFLFLRVLRCFSSPGSLQYSIYFCRDTGGLTPVGFPIRKSTDRGLFAAPRSLSQLIASFIGA